MGLCGGARLRECVMPVEVTEGLRSPSWAGGGYVRMPGLYMRLGWLCVSVCGSEGGCQFVVVVSV